MATTDKALPGLEQPATPDVQPATNSPRRFGQLQNLSVPDNFDDPLPDAEIAAWEGDSAPQLGEHLDRRGSRPGREPGVGAHP